MRRQITIAHSILSITSIFAFPSTYRSLRSLHTIILSNYSGSQLGAI
ncbi:MAG: hypothetical protein V7K14_12175 [Nostoc sp.]